MKSKTNQVILVYIVISMFAVIMSHKLLQHFLSDDKSNNYNFIKEILFILFTGGIFKLILAKNDQRNIAVFKKLKKTNEKIKESNENYNIVAKATRDTIWD